MWHTGGLIMHACMRNSKLTSARTFPADNYHHRILEALTTKVLRDYECSGGATSPSGSGLLVAISVITISEPDNLEPGQPQEPRLIAERHWLTCFKEKIRTPVRHFDTGSLPSSIERAHRIFNFCGKLGHLDTNYTNRKQLLHPLLHLVAFREKFSSYDLITCARDVLGSGRHLLD